MRRELTHLVKRPCWSGSEAQHCLELEVASQMANPGPAPPLLLPASRAFNTTRARTPLHTQGAKPPVPSPQHHPIHSSADPPVSPSLNGSPGSPAPMKGDHTQGTDISLGLSRTRTFTWKWEDMAGPGLSHETWDNDAFSGHALCLSDKIRS